MVSVQGILSCDKPKHWMSFIECNSVVYFSREVERGLGTFILIDHSYTK